MPSKPSATQRVGRADPDRGEWAAVVALRQRDADGVAKIVDAYSGSMLRFALVYIRDRQAAEEVVQETWLAALERISSFAGRSSLRTWLFAILLNKARTRGKRERRTTPFTALAARELEQPDVTVEPERFVRDGAAWGGHWAGAVPRPSDLPEERLLARELRDVIGRAIAELSLGQRTVITLRDVEGWTAQEVCHVLELSETNQRVLLHRARSRVRRALEGYLEESS
ncbi:MAG: RNA polymerase sigma factor [Solirubrobacteraceae bacterium]